MVVKSVERLKFTCLGVKIEINLIRQGLLETMGQERCEALIVKYGLDSYSFLGVDSFSRIVFYVIGRVWFMRPNSNSRIFRSHCVSFLKYSSHEHGSTSLEILHEFPRRWFDAKHFIVPRESTSNIPPLFHHLLRLVPRVQLHQHIDGPPFWSQFSHSRAKLK